MKKALFLTTSRRRTPWTGMSDATPLQSFIENRIAQEYDNKHLLPKDTDEALILNNYVPHCCPFCGAKSFIKYGKTTTGINKYKCKECSKYFSITTGTIFQDHKIPIFLMDRILFDFI